MTFEIRPIMVLDVQEDPDFPEIERRYTEECAQAGFEQGEVDWQTYKSMEELDALKVTGVYDNDKLVGFAAIILSYALHKSVQTATIDAIYILPEYRKGSLGVRLLKALGEKAKACGAEQLLVSAPPNSKIERLCGALKFSRLNTIYAYPLC